MAEQIVIKSDDVSAAFTYGKGLNLVSFKKGGVDVIEGVEHGFIGPHFGSRIPALLDGKQEPYPHGLARFEPWDVEAEGSSLAATFIGDEGNPEGQKFTIKVEAEIEGDVLKMRHSIVSQADSLAGSQFHLKLPSGQNTLQVDSRDRYYVGGVLEKRPENWQRLADGLLQLELNGSLEGGFLPMLKPLESLITLKTNDFQVEARYSCHSQESSWYIHCPQDGKMVSIAAVSSQNPWRPNLTVSSIESALRIC